MNKTWITGLTIAGIAGSGGMAFAGVSAIQNASADSTPAAAAPAATHSVTYQIGVAGLITIKSDGTMLTTDDPHPGTGWTFVGATSGAASHVEAQFTDGQQLVTFVADQVGSDIVVSVTNVEAPGATTTATPEPIVVTIVTGAPAREHHAAPPATPAPTPPAVSSEHAVVNPASATTTKSSPAHHEDDDHEADHESEQNDD